MERERTLRALVAPHPVPSPHLLGSSRTGSAVRSELAGTMVRLWLIPKLPSAHQHLCPLPTSSSAQRSGCHGPALPRTMAGSGQDQHLVKRGERRARHRRCCSDRASLLLASAAPEPPQADANPQLHPAATAQGHCRVPNLTRTQTNKGIKSHGSEFAPELPILPGCWVPGGSWGAYSLPELHRGSPQPTRRPQPHLAAAAGGAPGDGS